LLDASRMELRPGLRAVRSTGLALLALAARQRLLDRRGDASKVFRVGHLAAGGRTSDGAPPGPLREALRGLGYLEGQNIAYEARFAEGAVERLPSLAAELVGPKVNVIVAQGGAATEAARRATSTIPIIMAVAAGDAVARGWIAGLAYPAETSPG